MIAHEYCSDLHSSREFFKSLNNSSDTWEALENAEKLLQVARKKIMESTYDVPWLDLTLNRNTPSDLDESDLKIQQRVITKFQEVNKQKLCEKQIPSSRNTNGYLSHCLQDRNKISGCKTEIKKKYQPPAKVAEGCRKCSKEKMENKLKEKYKLKSFNQVNWKTKTSSKIINSKTNSETQLPIKNVKIPSTKSNLFNNCSKRKFKIVRASTVHDEYSKQRKDNDILINVAVQTSFKDQIIKEPVTSVEDTEQNQSEKHIDEHTTHQPEILNSPEKLEEEPKKCQMIIDNNHITNVNEDLKGSFVKLVDQISHEFENPVQIPSNSSKNFNLMQTSDIFEDNSWDEEFCDEWDAEDIDLNPPNLLNLDKILCNLDKNIGKMIKDTHKLEHLFIEIKSYNELDKTPDEQSKEKMNDQSLVLDGKSNDLDEKSNDLDEKVDFTNKSSQNRINLRQNHEKEISDSTDHSEKTKTSDEIKFILEPRSRISSYESVSSEVIHRHARFSTPLNNYRNIEVSNNVNKTNADTNCHEHEKYLFSERKDNVDVNVDSKNDVNVFITRNRLSSLSCEEKNSNLTEEKMTDNKKDRNCNLISASIGQSNEKFSYPEFSKNDDTEEYKVSSSFIECSSSSSPTNKHVSINSNNKTNNEIAEKHIQEQSEKSSADDRIRNDNHLLNDNEKENTNIENIEDEKYEVEIKKKLTPASSKNDIHNHTSFDISGIYSENSEELVADPKSIPKEHDTDKSGSLLSKNEIEEINKNTFENITQTKSERRLFNNLQTTNMDLKINEMNKSISSQVKIDKNPSTKLLKSLLADDNKKSLNENHEDMKNKSSLSTSISRSPSQKSISNFIFSQENPQINERGSSDSEKYSEGEIHLPDSCSYSIGELKILKTQFEEFTKNNQDLIQNIIHSSSDSYSPGEIRIPGFKRKQGKKNFQTQSYGEVLDTDVESSSGLESSGEI